MSNRQALEEQLNTKQTELRNVEKHLKELRDRLTSFYGSVEEEQRKAIEKEITSLEGDNGEQGKLQNEISELLKKVNAFDLYKEQIDGLSVLSAATFKKINTQVGMEVALEDSQKAELKNLLDRKLVELMRGENDLDRLNKLKTDAPLNSEDYPQTASLLEQKINELSEVKSILDSVDFRDIELIRKAFSIAVGHQNRSEIIKALRLGVEKYVHSDLNTPQEQVKYLEGLKAQGLGELVNDNFLNDQREVDKGDWGYELLQDAKSVVVTDVPRVKQILDDSNNVDNRDQVVRELKLAVQRHLDTLSNSSDRSEYLKDLRLNGLGELVDESMRTEEEQKVKKENEDALINDAQKISFDNVGNINSLLNSAISLGMKDKVIGILKTRFPSEILTSNIYGGDFQQKLNYVRALKNAGLSLDIIGNTEILLAAKVGENNFKDALDHVRGTSFSPDATAELNPRDLKYENLPEEQKQQVIAEAKQKVESHFDTIWNDYYSGIGSLKDVRTGAQAYIDGCRANGADRAIWGGLEAKMGEQMDNIKRKIREDLNDSSFVSNQRKVAELFLQLNEMDGVEDIRQEVLNKIASYIENATDTVGGSPIDFVYTTLKGYLDGLESDGIPADVLRPAREKWQERWSLVQEDDALALVSTIPATAFTLTNIQNIWKKVDNAAANPPRKVENPERLIGELKKGVVDTLRDNSDMTQAVAYVSGLKNAGLDPRIHEHLEGEIDKIKKDAEVLWGNSEVQSIIKNEIGRSGTAGPDSHFNTYIQVKIKKIDAKGLGELEYSILKDKYKKEEELYEKRETLPKALADKVKEILQDIVNAKDRSINHPGRSGALTLNVVDADGRINYQEVERLLESVPNVDSEMVDLSFRILTQAIEIEGEAYKKIREKQRELEEVEKKLKNLVWSIGLGAGWRFLSGVGVGLLGGFVGGGLASFSGAGVGAGPGSLFGGALGGGVGLIPAILFMRKEMQKEVKLKDQMSDLIGELDNLGVKYKSVMRENIREVEEYMRRAMLAGSDYTTNLEEDRRQAMSAMGGINLQRI